MFTGIVEKLGRVESLQEDEKGARFVIATGYSDLALGESVAVNGVCLTVAELVSGQALFFASLETLRRTNLVQLQSGSLLNLERALTQNTRLSGHWVQGHVDGLARVASVTPEGESYRVELLLDRSMGRYCIEKGSIALNGVSLTLSEVADVSERETRIAVHLIPYSWKHTNISLLKAGDPVNVEVDLFAKYVERLCQPYLKP
jgi:riboflavin synthase